MDVRFPARPPERALHDAVVFLLAQAARVPPIKPLIHLVVQIVLLGLSDQNLRLLRQARHVRETRRPAARAPAHEALLCFPVEGFRADVARLTFCVVRTRLRRNRHGLLIFVVGVVLFRVAAAVNSLADLLVAAAPVVVLACGIAVPGFAPHASRGVVLHLRRFEEAKALLRKTIPVVQRVFGICHDLTLTINLIYAEALYKDDGATLDDLREAVSTLEETERIARRVLGSAHPLAEQIEYHLQVSRAALGARGTLQLAGDA